EVVGGERGLCREPRRGEIGGARLGVRDVALDEAADAAPEIEIPARRRREVVERLAAAPAAAAPAGAAPAIAEAGALGREAGIDRRIITGAGGGDDGARLPERRLGRLQRLVRDIDPALEAVEQRILVHRPPGAAIDGILRLADLPALLLVTGRDDR